MAFLKESNMKAKLNNLIEKYETEKGRLIDIGLNTVENRHKYETVKEVLRALSSLRS